MRQTAFRMAHSVCTYHVGPRCRQFHIYVHLAESKRPDNAVDKDPGFLSLLGRFVRSRMVHLRKHIHLQGRDHRVYRSRVRSVILEHLPDWCQAGRTTNHRASLRLHRVPALDLHPLQPLLRLHGLQGLPGPERLHLVKDGEGPALKRWRKCLRGYRIRQVEDVCDLRIRGRSRESTRENKWVRGESWRLLTRNQHNKAQKASHRDQWRPDQSLNEKAPRQVELKERRRQFPEKLTAARTGLTTVANIQEDNDQMPAMRQGVHCDWRSSHQRGWDAHIPRKVLHLKDERGKTGRGRDWPQADQAVYHRAGWRCWSWSASTKKVPISSGSV